MEKPRLARLANGLRLSAKAEPNTGWGFGLGIVIGIAPCLSLGDRRDAILLRRAVRQADDELQIDTDEEAGVIDDVLVATRILDVRIRM